MDIASSTPLGDQETMANADAVGMVSKPIVGCAKQLVRIEKLRICFVISCSRTLYIYTANRRQGYGPVIVYKHLRLPFIKIAPVLW